MGFEIKGLSEKIGDKDILKDINISLVPGEIVGLIGRNGVGKTTLFRSIAGQYIPDTGDILIDDQWIEEDLTLKEKLFYLDTQNNFFDSYTIDKIADFYELAYQTFDREKYNNWVIEYDLPRQTKYRQFSKGMQGLFNIVLAFSTGAPYVILDEPLDGLDVIVRKQVFQIIIDAVSEDQRGVLISSHNLEELDRLIDRAIVLKGSHIVSDYRLEDTRSEARKVQLVFKSKEIPTFVKENSRAISIQGRVVVVLFEHYSAELEAQIQAEDPALFEELPLTLEDLFRASISAKESTEGEK
ncbi:ATP-binding cassette domain-containing protein [Dellaglioa carnosa]|uniref:ABC transporter ATP-binding protein n=1 Tax=Dellaglioa carnosa TaxID=2995136 RepID=A0ABT4JMW7_9LACO|nr:ABC transporter ATP-binding protein [Dellaglioa carnosa]MCZ2491678.1 ABC transporter ATP-binding protein [Dellaglioa carnosa]MCZ2494755.1 ABC transporter ATP-binding protein [Dellaglioa carnosa]MDK1731586.1 ABC transporter ATP-binding protein [Dellaglioa carnosa]